MSSFDHKVLEKLQAKWKGRRTREGEYTRAKAGATILCPYLASPPSVVQAVLQLAGDRLRSERANTLFYDLGCGEGNVVVGVASAIESVSCVGVDIDPTLCATARRCAIEAGVQSRVEIRQDDLAAMTSFTDCNASPCSGSDGNTDNGKGIAQAAEMNVSTAGQNQIPNASVDESKEKEGVSLARRKRSSITAQQGVLIQDMYARMLASGQVHVPSGDTDSSGDEMYITEGRHLSNNLAKPAPVLVIYAFLVPSCLAVLSKALFKNLSTGTTLILYKFPLPESDGWVPSAVVTVEDAVKKGAEAQLFMYELNGN